METQDSIDKAPWYIRLLFVLLCMTGLIIPLMFIGEIISFLFGLNKEDNQIDAW
jgi:hypothetical protein